MHLIDNGTQGGTSVPTPQTASGTPGYAKSGTPGGFPPTVFDPDMGNTLIAELKTVIDAASIALDRTNNAQLLQALFALSGKNVQVFTASGTFTVPPHVTVVDVEVWGPGGGTWGSTSATVNTSGAGAGGYSRKLITGLTPGGTVTVTVGAVGAAGTSGGGAGTDGGTSSFGAYCSATGGKAGATVTFEGVGGTATGGDVNINGQQGWSYMNVGANVYGGHGRASPRGGPGGAGGSTGGLAGIAPGGGASGSSGGASYPGAPGGAGQVTVRW